MYKSGTYYKDLLSRFIRNEVTPDEVEELCAFIESAPQEYKEMLLQEDIMALTAEVAHRSPMVFSDEDIHHVRAQLLLHAGLQADKAQPIARGVRFLHRRWVRYAAAVILVAGIATAIIVSGHRQRTGSGMASVNESSDGNILPGADKAVLTLDDRQIDLAPDKNGIAVGETIAYTDGEKLSVAGKRLTLATPNGGQYQLVLPDGSKAWLNAASSISFPSAFDGERRRVKITGEVYLEVRKDNARPFLVDVDGKSTVEVLGTSFNINAYANEGTIKTTVAEGSVRVGATDIAGPDKVLLKPGQQAIVAAKTPVTDTQARIAVLSDVDLSQTLAWKNGLFSFNNADIQTVMRQLERWYDIRVRYEGKDSGITIDGKMYRNVNLSSVLEFLRESGVRFRMENKTLIIL
ncbi:FecR family protein [Chitinophaga varians]|uniref:FecR family protein n=1 Tax=Chitinophaga varians TaxID=2202339 RepID=UPI00165EE12C|nr:FecR family protein [Chitinophaga varians]MBC9909149.1 FecR domain-containing protein [Chitinophaga varians]